MPVNPAVSHPTKRGSFASFFIASAAALKSAA